MTPILTEYTDQRGRRVQFFKYKSFYDFVADVKRTPTGVPLSALSSRKTGNSDFYGTEKWEDTIKLVEYGWPEGLTKFKQVMENLDIDLGRIKDDITLEWDVAGDIVDVGTFCSGQPEHMIQFPTDQSVGKGKIVEIAIDLGAHCGISTETFHRRGAIICALTEYLILKGYGVEVLGYDGVSYRRGIGGVGVPIHRAGDIFDMDKLVFCTANASFFRRMFFSFYELHMNINEHTQPGYGSPYHDFDIKSDIVFGGSWYDHCGNDEAAKRFVLDCVKRFNAKESAEHVR